MKRLNELLFEGKGSDVDISFGTKTLHLHKFILEEYSSYFKSLFSGNWKDEQIVLPFEERIGTIVFQLIYDIVSVGSHYLEDQIKLRHYLKFLGVVELRAHRYLSLKNVFGWFVGENNKINFGDNEPFLTRLIQATENWQLGELRIYLDCDRETCINHIRVFVENELRRIGGNNICLYVGHRLRYNSITIHLTEEQADCIFEELVPDELLQL